MSSDGRPSHKVQKSSILNPNKEHVLELCNKKIKCITGRSYKAFFKKQCTQITSENAQELGRLEIIPVDQSIARDNFSSPETRTMQTWAVELPFSVSSRKRQDGDINHPKERGVPSPASGETYKRKRVEKLNSELHDAHIRENQSGESRCESEMELLKEKHQKEMKDFQRSWERKRLGLLSDHKRESARICSANNQPIRSYKLNELDKRIASEMKEHEQEMNKRLKDILGTHNLEKIELRKSAHHPLPLNPKRGEMCDEDAEGNNCTSVQIPSSTCKNSNIGAIDEVNHENHSGQPPERPEPPVGHRSICLPSVLSKSPLKNNIHNNEETNGMKTCVQSETPNMEKEIDQVKDGSVGGSDQNTGSTSPSCDFERQIPNAVNSNLRAEKVPNKRCEIAPRLEATANCSIEIATLNVDEPVTRDKTRSVVSRDAIRAEECNQHSLEIVPSQIQSDSASLPVAQDQTEFARVWPVLLTSERPVKPSYDNDILGVVFARLCKDNEQDIQLHEAMKLRLKFDEENEIAEIKRKYEAKHREVEIAYSKKKQEIDTKCMLVSQHRALAMVYRLTNPDHRKVAEAEQDPNYSITEPQSSYAFASPLSYPFLGFQQPRHSRHRGR